MNVKSLVATLFALCSQDKRLGGLITFSRLHQIYIIQRVYRSCQTETAVLNPDAGIELWQVSNQATSLKLRTVSPWKSECTVSDKLLTSKKVCAFTRSSPICTLPFSATSIIDHLKPQTSPYFYASISFPSTLGTLIILYQRCFYVCCWWYGINEINCVLIFFLLCL